MAAKLEDALFNSKVNKDNFSSLLELYSKAPDVFVAFIGAGISSAITGVPDLKGLYVSWCEKYGCSVDGNGESPEAFGVLYKHVEDKEKFDQELFTKTIPKNTRHTSTHIEIARAFNCFVTTNYYDPIEDGFRQKQDLTSSKPEELTKFYFVFPPQERARHSLTYLHGNPNTGFCILRKKDYQYFYPSLYERHNGVYVVENSLCDILTNYTIIFLGSSLEFHLRSFLKHLLAKIAKENSSKSDNETKREVKMHYWVTSDSEINKYLGAAPEEQKENFQQKYFHDYSQMNVKPVIYTGDHIFVEDLCKTLAKLLEARTTSLAGSTYTPS
ncbi:MAG: SIR2 family protein [Candidatus Omnitrophota bacterium]